jgi:outer membrane protein
MRNKIVNCFGLLLLGILLPCNHLLAQNKRSISLKEAIRLSLEHSNQLKLANARVDEATAMAREARGHRLPDVAVTGGYLRVNTPTIDLKVKPATQEGAAGNPVRVNQVSYGLVNASVPIFSGFRISEGIRSATYLEKAATLDATLDSNEVIEQTFEAYSNAYKAHEALKLVEDNLRSSRSRVMDFTNLEKNGLVARNDLLKVQLQQSNIELAILDAENNWKLASITLNLLLGLKEDVEIELDNTWFEETTDDPGYLGWEKLALNNRPDLEALDYRTKAAAAGVRAAKGEYYPSLALTGGYVAAYIPNFLTVANAMNIGLGLKYSPSSLWKSGAKVDQAKARAHQLEASHNLLNDAIRLEMGHNYQNYLLLRKKIDVYNKAMEQAIENYRIVRNKHENNLSTTTDLLDADVAQLQARIDVAFARADAMVAYNRLRKTAGVLTR